MQREIIWFTTYMPNVEKLNRFFAERKINISAYYSPIEEIYNSIHRLIEEAGLKVAIIRGGFAPEIKNNISIPVVNVNQTAIDFSPDREPFKESRAGRLVFRGAGIGLFPEAGKGRDPLC